MFFSDQWCGRIPVVVDDVVVITTSDETVDVLVTDHGIAVNPRRRGARDWQLPAMRKRIGRMSAGEVQARARKANIPFAPVGRPQDLFDDPHLNQSGGLLDVQLPEVRMTRRPKLPLRLCAAGVLLTD